MRFRTTLLVAVTSVLTVVSPAHADQPSPLPAPSPTPAHHDAGADWNYVRHELFDVPLAQFLIDARLGDTWFDWSNDGCSAPLVGSTGRSFDFRAACRRHDFGYRNLHRLEHRYGSGRTYWNGGNRRRVDQQFLADMKSHCRTRSWLLRPNCFVTAWTFYAAVRAVAGP